MKIDRFEYDVETNSAPSIVDAAERPAHHSVTAAVPSTSATSPTCATATRRRPTSCACDGQRGVLHEHHEDRLRLHARHHQQYQAAPCSRIKGQLPAGFKIDPLGDQSVFVRGAITGVVREAIIAALLTALMILLFLGSWRSTLIIAISIPLSILGSIICARSAGRDHQHHDAGWDGARGRHPRG